MFTWKDFRDYLHERKVKKEVTPKTVDLPGLRPERSPTTVSTTDDHIHRLQDYKTSLQYRIGFQNVLVVSLIYYIFFINAKNERHLQAKKKYFV